MRVNTLFYGLIVCLSLLNWQALAKPLNVKIEQAGDNFHLLVDGQAFIIKGVGLDSTRPTSFQALKDFGGNAFRTWRPDNLALELEQAQRLGLKVAVGLGLKKQLEGFDYRNAQAVEAQFQRIKHVVDTYKSHPSVLIWVIANEPNLLFDEKGELTLVDDEVYRQIERVARYIKAVDPNHLVTFTFAGAIKAHMDRALALTPSIDFASVQVYGDLLHLNHAIAQLNYKGPLMVTEYGPLGHWEVESTQSGREIEPPGGLQAQYMSKRIETSLLGRLDGRLIGDFAFLWGQKQERTPTWYGMINADGALNARADVLYHYWNNAYPENRAPLVTKMTLNGQQAKDNISVSQRQWVDVHVDVTDPDGDPIRSEVILLGEVERKSQGGAFEQTPESHVVDGLTIDYEVGGVSIRFKAPSKAGEYRVFVYSYDTSNRVGNGNIPFRVL